MSDIVTNEKIISLGTLSYNNDKMKEYMQEEIGKIPGLVVDDTLSDTSENPVQNKVINAALNSKADQTTVDNALAQKANSADVTASLAGKSDTGHTHDDRYYTESETNTLLGDKVGVSAFNSHANDTTVHVTAAEKASWNGKAELSDIPTSLPANGGNADTVDRLHASDFYQIESGLRTEAVYYDIFSTTLSSSHACWNKWCCVIGNSSDTSTSDYINNAPESGYGALEYEVFTGGYHNRAFQLAIGCFAWQNNTFIRYQQDGNWSGWKNIADGGNAQTLGTHSVSDFVLKSDYDALAARVAALDGGTA